MTKTPREKWEVQVSWESYVFNCLERFVLTTDKKYISKFVTTGDINYLYNSGIHQPDPIPTEIHQQYLEEFARYYLERN